MKKYFVKFDDRSNRYWILFGSCEDPNAKEITEDEAYSYLNKCHWSGYFAESFLKNLENKQFKNQWIPM